MRQDAKSLALYLAIRDKIQRTDTMAHLVQAKSWAQRFFKERPEDIWLAEWVERLDAAIASPEALEDLYALMGSTEQHAIDMRSSSPFSGVLTTKERTEVLVRFVESWKKGEWLPTGDRA
jgi:hypothetical protein